MRKYFSIYIFFLVLLPACGPVHHAPDLGNFYNELAQHRDPHRNPILVIPGLMGSKLVDQDSGKTVWGAFGLGQVDPNTSKGARLVALPMAPGQPLRELQDNIESAGVLARVIFNFFGFPFTAQCLFELEMGLFFIQNASLTQKGVILAVLSGAIASGIGYTIWYVALGGLSATVAALAQLLVPVIAALGGVVFVSESLSIRFLLSASMILGGISLVVFGKRFSVNYRALQ